MWNKEAIGQAVCLALELLRYRELQIRPVPHQAAAPLTGLARLGEQKRRPPLSYIFDKWLVNIVVFVIISAWLTCLLSSMRTHDLLAAPPDEGEGSQMLYCVMLSWPASLK